MGRDIFRLVVCCWIVIVSSFSTTFSQIDTLIICNPGDPIVISTIADKSGYRWTPSASLSNPTIHNPVARPSENTLYVVEIIQSTTSANLIENPSFENGNEGFFSDYGFVELIRQQGVYGVSTSAANLNSVFFEDCPDHTTGDGQMMVVDGSPTPNEFVWCQTIDVVPNTDYSFSTWLSSVNPSNPAILQFFINGSPFGETFRSTNNLCQWRRFYETWNAGDTSSARICIINRNTNPDGNDFALDDFGFFELEEILYDSVYVQIEALTAAEERRVYWPNIFSPNGDRLHDTFYPKVDKGVVSLRQFSVYDRWGNKMHDISNCDPGEITNCGWTGIANGNTAETGTYSYTAEVLFVDGNEVMYTGSVFLLR